VKQTFVFHNISDCYIVSAMEFIRYWREEDMDKKLPELEEKQPAPQYVPPMIITYDGDALLEEMGPAQSCASPGCPVDLP